MPLAVRSVCAAVLQFAGEEDLGEARGEGGGAEFAAEGVHALKVGLEWA